MSETIELIRAAKSGNELAFEQIVTDNAPLVWSIVRRFLGRGADADDLYQLGCLGLVKAIYGFDTERGLQFSTYAVPKISGEIRRFLRDDGSVKVSRTIKERAVKIRHAANQIRSEKGYEPSLSEISAATGFSPEEIAQAENALCSTESLDREINENGQTLESLLGNDGIEEKTLEYISLSNAICELPGRERTVLKLRYFKCMTQEQTARIMKISQVQVSRIERAAITALKDKLT